MTTLHIAFSDEQVEYLKTLSERTGRSIDDLVRSNVDEEVRKDSKTVSYAGQEEFEKVSREVVADNIELLRRLAK